VFERFTDRARRVVVLAQEEARLLNHNYIGTEHILLGLIHEGDGVAARTLESLGISLEAVRAQVEEIIGRGGSAPSGHIPFTPRAKKVLELSLREALQLGHNYIGTEHILLGLIREGEGVAAQVLVKLGADLSGVRRRVIEILSGVGGSVSVQDMPAHFPVRRRTAGLVRSSMRTPQSAPRCSFCRRDLSELEHHATGLHATICNDCIVAAHAALVAAPAGQRILVLPPRVVGSPPSDDPGAGGKVAAAFHAVFGRAGPDASDDLEDGDRLMPRFAKALDDLPQMHIGDVRVVEVGFISPDLAEVRFNLFLDEVGTDYPLVGAARRAGPRWVVSADTILHVLAGLGIQLPPEA
jgi:hypothetical protein